jgi:glutamine synthetase
MAAVAAGVHYGLTQHCDPGEMIPEGAEMEEQITLPRRWHQALDRFEAAAVLPQYLGAEYCRMYATVKRGECEQFYTQVSNMDYQWYLRSL